MIEWSDKNKNIIANLIVFLVCYICLVYLALRPPYAFDSFWHLKLGEDLLLNGLSPWVDRYSFSYYESEVSRVPVIFQVLLALFFSVFGEANGFFSFKVFYITVLLIFIALYFKKIKSPAFVVFLVLPFIAYFIHARLIIRPDILSNILIVICLTLYFTARKSFGNKELIAIAVLLLFWVNYHSPVFGYVLIFGLFVDKAINKITGNDNSFSWCYWFLWGVLIFLIGFVNYRGEHFFILMLSFLSSDFSKYIQEYLPAHEVFNADKLVYFSWLVTVVLVPWSVYKKHYGLSFVLSFLFYFSLTSARAVPAIALIDFYILAYFLSQVSYKGLLKYISMPIINIIVVFASLVALFAYYTLVMDIMVTLTNHKNEKIIIKERYPEEVSNYLRDYQQGGNILNELRTGGYLMYKLSPDYKVYIDGRTNILYPVEFFKHAYNVMNNDVALKNEIEIKNVDYVVYKNAPDKYSMFSKIESMKLNLADQNFLLFSKKNKPGFTVISKLLLYPMCWSDKLSLDIYREINLANVIALDEEFEVKKHLNMLESYLEKRDLENLHVFESHSDASRRLAAYVSLESYNYNEASILFSMIDNVNEYDVLMMAYSYMKANEYKKSEEALKRYLEKNGYLNGEKQLPLNISLMFLQILTVIESKSGLSIFPDVFVRNLENAVRQVIGDKKNIPIWVSPHKEACKVMF